MLFTGSELQQILAINTQDCFEYFENSVKQKNKKIL